MVIKAAMAPEPRSIYFTEEEMNDLIDGSLPEVKGPDTDTISLDSIRDKDPYLNWLLDYRQ